jgi:hypothetical protein
LIGLVNQFIYLFILLDWNNNFVFCLAHGEQWELGGKTNNGTTSTTTMNKIRPSPYSNVNGITPNQFPIRPRSKSKRRSQVRLRSDISQTRPAYSRQQSQIERGNRQSQSILPVWT